MAYGANLVILPDVCFICTLLLNPYSAGIDFSRQILTSVDVLHIFLMAVDT